MEPSTEQSPYAGFWSRAAARIIDLVLIIAAFNLIYLADRLGADAGLWSDMGIGEGGSAAAGFSMANVLRGLFFFAFPVFYYVYLHGTYGQTFGKMALRIRVVNEDGTPLDHRKAFLRWLGYFLCDLTFYIGYLWAAFDHRNQGLHDKVCKTVVVRADVPYPLPAEAEPVPPAPASESEPSSGDTVPGDPSLDTSAKPPI
ncbi:MAG: RDD family protein [Deltaproteobacteria bacterium]